jgi:mannose-6-phosphate isomerase
MEFPKRVVKTWGEEVWFANDPERNYCGKELIFKAGFQTSIHRHLVKDEVFYGVQGSFLIFMGREPDALGKIILNPGDRLHLPVGWWHRIAAGEDSRLIEVSTFHSDDDVERYAPSGPVSVPVLLGQSHCLGCTDLSR